MADDLVRVGVAEAARRLGVSAQTIRRRLEAGELVGEHEAARRGTGWRWMVLLPASKQVPGSRYEAPPAQDGLLVAELRSRIASLEEHLAQAERASSETRQLLGGTLARLAAAEERLMIAPPAGTERNTTQHQSGNTESPAPVPSAPPLRALVGDIRRLVRARLWGA